MSEVLVSVKLEVVTCCSCGIPFGMPDYHKKRLLATGDEFWCPNGHRQYFSESDVQRLERQLKESKRQVELFKGCYEIEQADHDYTRRRLSATKGVLTKTKSRVANGICPCCNRHFENLQRHMGNKHPNYSTVETGNATQQGAAPDADGEAVSNVELHSS